MQNIWTLEASHDLIHFVTAPPTLQSGIRYFHAGARVCAEISRRIICPIGRESVSSRYFFIMFDEVAGVSIVDVLRDWPGLQTEFVTNRQ